MRRREFITLFCGAAAAWPQAARAQQRTIPVVVYFSGGGAPSPQVLAALRKGLGENGFIDGQNVAIEYVLADGQYDRLPALAADLVRRPVAVIAALTDPAAIAAKVATTTIPIVIRTASDPVMLGLVNSLNRPGGNVTGISRFTAQLSSKRLSLLHDLVPKATVVAMLVNPTNPNTDLQVREMQAAARALGLELRVLNAATSGEIDAAFETIVKERPGALIMSGDNFLSAVAREQMVALTARHAIPTMHVESDTTKAGGLISYDADAADMTREQGIYVGKILKGAKPADLPVLQPTKFQIVLNLKTAKALGLEIPPGLLAIVDEVIE